MSMVPKAKQSSITNLTVEPDLWDSYPKVEYSELKSCTFRNLKSDTSIERSTLHNVLLEGGPKKIVVERSDLRNCTITTSPTTETGYMSDSSLYNVKVERSQLIDCTVASTGFVGRTEAKRTNFVGCKHVERTKFEDSSVMGKSFVERSTVTRSLIADSSKCERSQLDQVVLTKSKVERSTLTDCDIMECEIQGTEFKGMILKYGIWHKGDLVGRTCNKEVVRQPRFTAMEPMIPRTPEIPQIPQIPQTSQSTILEVPLQRRPVPAAVPFSGPSGSQLDPQDVSRYPLAPGTISECN